MKGIAISTIFLFLIAIVSIILLISFVGGNLPSSLKQGYCFIVQGLGGFLPLPEHMKPSLPSFCSIGRTFQEIIIIEAEDPDKVSYEIASHTLACWEITGKIKKGQNTNCFELVLKRLNKEVTREMVIEKLPEDYRNRIDWQIDSINTPKSIGIYYDADNQLIVVV
jgi:hypothetical protein